MATQMKKSPASSAKSSASTATISRKERKDIKVSEKKFTWVGVDRKGKKVKGEMFAASENVVKLMLRSKGITPQKITKALFSSPKPIKDEEVTMFTRQLSTMMRAGVPLLQAFEIVANGHANPSVGKLLNSIKQDIETGSSLSQAFSKYPKQFDALFCNLIGAGEQAGILDSILDSLALYKEKMLAIKSKIKAAMFYPIAVVAVAVGVTAVIMIFVVPQFTEIFRGFGAELPGPTLVVVAISNFFIHQWYVLLGMVAGTIIGLKKLLERSKKARDIRDRIVLRLPVFGNILNKSAVARWCRTLGTMFKAGVPIVEALNSVAGAAGNIVYYNATKSIQTEISSGIALNVAMDNAGVFPPMMIQMAAIGEESGALDVMLEKVAEFYEQEVDDAVGALSSLLEPIIIVFLGTVVGGIVVAMYLPIFKLGSVV